MIFNAIVLILIFAIIALIELAIIWTYAKDNGELRAKAEYDAETVRFLKSDAAPFDRDGDGRIGGSKRKA